MQRSKTPTLQKDLDRAVNVLWELHDEAQSVGDTALAADFAGKVFQLLEQLPENSIHLSTRH